jgi:hypothetical protein
MKYFWIFLIILFAGIIRLNYLSDIPPVLLQRELQTGLACRALETATLPEIFKLFSTNFGFINTSSISPLSILVTCPFIKSLGLTPYAVRLPAVCIGLLTIVILFFLSYEFYPYLSKFKPSIFKTLTFSLIFTASVAFSPWHIQLSRINTAGILGIFNIFIGIFIILYKPKKIFFKCLIPVILAMAVYADYSTFLPVLIILTVMLYYYKSLRSQIIFMIIIFLGLIIPLFSPLYLSNFKPDKLTGDAVFSQIKLAEQRRYQTGNSLKDRIFIQERIGIIKYYLKNLFDYIELKEMFVRWDYSPNEITTQAGMFYPFEIILLMLGGIALARTNRKLFLLSLLMIVLIFLQSAYLKYSPDALKFSPVFVILSCYISFGIIQYPNKYLLVLIVFYLYFVGRYSFLFSYNHCIQIPDYINDYKQALNHVAKIIQPGQSVVITDITYGNDISLYWVYFNKQDKLVKKYALSGKAFKFDNYNFVSEVPNKYHPSVIYIQPRQKFPGLINIDFVSQNPDEAKQIGVFTIIL